MAIESRYWKEELARINHSIRPTLKPKRWTERAVCSVERDLMIGFFIVRRMIELNKVASSISKTPLEVFSVPVAKNVTMLNRYELHENYDWQRENAEQKSATYVSNQCIHAYVSFIDRGADRNLSDLFVVSDYDRNDVIWRVPFVTIRTLFGAVSASWPSSLHMIYDHKSKDYRVTVD